MTVSISRNNQLVLDQANPQDIADVLRKYRFGTMFAKVPPTTVTQSAAATMTLSPPAVLGTLMVRVTTVGTAAAGFRNVADVAATPSATLATLSNDGKTLTFEGTVTAAVVSYMAAPGSDTSASTTVITAGDPNLGATLFVTP